MTGRRSPATPAARLTGLRIGLLAVLLAVLLAGCSGATTQAGPAGTVPGTSSAAGPVPATSQASPGAAASSGSSGSSSSPAATSSGPSGTPSRTPSLGPGATPRRPTPPPANVVFDYQIGGAYPPAAGVRIVDRDRTDPAVPGLYNICYLNGFQTQPGERTTWPESAVLHDAKGRPVADPDWPDEYLLDTRTAAAREVIATKVRGWAASCARRGYQAVEIDNLDTFTRSPLLTKKGNLALAARIVRDAHALGLAVGQKNAVEMADEGRRTVGFDFAIAEECQVYDECGGYLAAYGARVYEVEYPDAGGTGNFRAACADHGARITIVYRDRDVVPRGRAGYVNRTC